MTRTVVDTTPKPETSALAFRRRSERFCFLAPPRVTVDGNEVTVLLLAESPRLGADIEVYLHWRSDGAAWVDEKVTERNFHPLGRNRYALLTTISGFAPGDYCLTAFFTLDGFAHRHWLGDSAVRFVVAGAPPARRRSPAPMTVVTRRPRGEGQSIRKSPC